MSASLSSDRWPRFYARPGDPLLVQEARWDARLPQSPECWLAIPPARVAQPVRFRPRRNIQTVGNIIAWMLVLLGMYLSCVGIIDIARALLSWAGW